MQGKNIFVVTRLEFQQTERGPDLSPYRSSAERKRLFDPGLRWIIAIGCAIAAFAPFDTIFAAATFGSMLARIALIAVMAWTGWLAASRSGCGLHIEGHSAKRPFWIGTMAALAVAVYVAVLDCYLFRAKLRPELVELLQQPLYVRLIGFMMRAFLENIIYRLFVFSVLAFALSKLRLASTPNIAVAMIIAQCINISFNVVVLEPVTASLLFYDAIRYVAPGVLWAWLYLRFGFVTAEVASVGCHIFLQPMFSGFLR
ncbi:MULTISPECIES: hypothetical protein [unclassified Bradyrhizobium]